MAAESRRALVACVVAAICAAQDLPGQTADQVNGALIRDTAGPQYKAGSFRRALLGSTWRHLWIAPIDVPVLDLARHGGGLTAVREGGNQSRTLHFDGGDGRRYVFRTTDKRLAPRYNADILGTPIGRIVEDQLSTQHPASVLMAHVIEDAAGVLHPEPRLVRLPDDARLGEFRASFAHLLGFIAERPDDVAAGIAPFAGAQHFTGADGLLEHLDASHAYRLDAAAWLTARLVDGLIGDFDRGADQWEFGCYEVREVRLCRPIARDRDWAFMRANGLVMRLVRSSSPKLGLFDSPRVGVRSLTAMTVEFDRSHLVGLSRTAWDSVTSELQGRLTDAVLEDAIRAQPPGYQSEHSMQLLRTSLRARRNALPMRARELYAVVNEQADVFGTDTSETVDVERAANGSVRVTMRRSDDSIVLDRTFDPIETREIRIYLQDGDDRAIVRGRAERSIAVRITGGAGNDVLVDSSVVTGGGASTLFYDASGDNRIVTGSGTRVDRRPYVTTQPVKLDPPEDEVPKPRIVSEERRGRFEDQRPGAAVGPVGFAEGGERSDRSWGRRSMLQPAFDYKDGAGVIIGAALTDTVHAFRKNPYASKVGLRVFYATGSRGLGVQLDGDWRGTDSPLALITRVRATQFESQRFYGFGNDSPRVPAEDARIMRDEVTAQAALRWQMGEDTHVSFGPVIRWVRPNTLPAEPAPARLAGDSAFGAAGATAVFEHASVDQRVAPHRGYRVSLGGTTHAGAWDASDAFGGANGEVAGYVPVHTATIAMRLGGRHVWGVFPVHEAAMLGGRATLRGHEWNRYAGDAVAYGSTELRLPFARVELLARGDLSAIVLADAGRVWVDGESPGGWHTAAGAGLSFETLGKVFSVVYAQGEVRRVYAYLGNPF